MNDNLKSLVERLYRHEWNESNLTFHEVLRRMYLDMDMSVLNISDEIGISVGAVHNYLKQEGIQKNIRCKY